MKNNKLLSVILALLVCFSLAVTVSATTDNELIFALESSDSSGAALDANVFAKGDEFTVTVNVEKNPGILAAVTSLKYDAEVLELVSAENATTGVTVKNDTGVVTITIGDIRAILNPTANTVVNTTGAVATLTFKVIAEEDTTSVVELVALPQQVVGSDRTCSVAPVGAEMDVTVVGADHDHADYETVDANNAVEATCTEAGKKSDLLCAHCGEIVTAGEEIAALGHDFSGEGVITTEPGCETMGVRTYTCANGCGETQVDDKVPAIGHAFGDWTVTKAATVEAEGEETRTCANCNGTEKRSIAKLPAPATQPTQPTQPTEPAAKGVSPWVIVAIVVVVLAGAGVAAFFVLKNKKK